MTTDPTIALGVLFYAPAWGIALWAGCHLLKQGWLKACDRIFNDETKTY